MVSRTRVEISTPIGKVMHMSPTHTGLMALGRTHPTIPTASPGRRNHQILVYH